MHPYQNTLYGIADLLSMYNIKTKGIKIKEKDSFNFELLKYPFVAQLGESFVNVIGIKNNKIIYTLGGRFTRLTRVDFVKLWTGVLLIIEEKDKAKEPFYTENIKKYLYKKLMKWSVLSLLCVCVFWNYVANEIYSVLVKNILLVLDFVGIYICYLLFLKQEYINNSYADKLCTLFKGSDCNGVLESRMSKLGGIISWSEIGLAYFISNFIVLIFLTHLQIYSVYINLFILPYTFWSIWYQKFRVKQWCPLCLIVQFLFWGIFIINFIFKEISKPEFFALDILEVVLIYVSLIFLIHFFSLYTLISRDKKNIEFKLNSIKSEEEVFKVLHKEQPYYEIDDLNSHIIFGNPSAKLRITIVTNPHCTPCAVLHERMFKMLAIFGQKICVQYVFVSFTKELEISTRFLIAVYKNKSPQEVETIYNEWFSKGRKKRLNFIKNHNVDMNMSEINEELKEHEVWCRKNKIQITPIILINGYKLNKYYMVEDIRYFI